VGGLSLVNDSFSGGTALKVGDNSGDDQAWLIHNQSIPYDPTRRYKIRVVLKRTAGAGTCYVGVAGRNATDTAWVNTSGANSVSSQFYIAALDVAVPNTFTVYEGVFGAEGASLHANAKYFRPLIITNYPSLAGTVIVDSYTIEVVGEAGADGAGFYTLTLRDGAFPSNATATADFVSYIGRYPVNQDHLVYRNAAGTVSSAKMFQNGLWVAPTLLINGSLIATGSIAGDKILAGTEISGPIVTGGLLRTSASGMRVETTNDGDYLIWAGDGVKNDANGIYWIKKNGTGFIKSQFFQGQIIESKMGTGSSISGAILTLTASNHNSSGFAVEVTATGYVSAKASGNQTSKSFIVRVSIKRNGLQIGSFDTRLAGSYESLETETYWSGNVGGTVIDTDSTSGIRTYTAEITMVGTVSPFSLIARSGTIKTFENKLAS